jgi:hypothetical protein
MWIRRHGSVARASGWMWAAGGVVWVAVACGEDSAGPPANGGSGGSSAGNSAVSGSGGVSGQTGIAGRPGSSGCGPVAPVEVDERLTRVQGEGFDYPDGTDVTGTVGYRPSETATATASLAGGSFALEFPGPIASCATATLSFALYVDVNGDGSCQLATDDVFVRSANPESGSFAPLSLSRDSERCPALSAFRAPDVVAAARRLCPEIGDCLPFCSEPEPTATSPAGSFGGFCTDQLDGGTNAGLDGGGSDGGDAAVDGGP